MYDSGRSMAYKVLQTQVITGLHCQWEMSRFHSLVIGETMPADRLCSTSSTRDMTGKWSKIIPDVLYYHREIARHPKETYYLSSGAWKYTLSDTVCVQHTLLPYSLILQLFRVQVKIKGNTKRGGGCITLVSPFCEISQFNKSIGVQWKGSSTCMYNE